MRRILLIGSGGAGKSTLARTLAERTELPLIHLDALYWRPGWVETPAAEWRGIVAGLLQREAWVMDGNFGSTLDLRLAACDTVIFLDLSPAVCLWRVMKRRLRYRGESRPDMTQGCPERLDLDFLLWIAFYRLRRRKAILGKLVAAAGNGKRAIVLNSDAAVAAFVSALPRPASVSG